MSINIADCPRCGKLFVKIFHEVCQGCLQAIEEEFKLVYNFVRNQPDRKANSGFYQTEAFVS